MYYYTDFIYNEGMDIPILEPAFKEIMEFTAAPNAFRSMIILVVALVVSYIASKFLANGVVRVAQIVGTKSDNVTSYEKKLRYQQIETYLSIAVAIVRGFVVAVVAYVTWRLLAPHTSSSGLAAIGAGTFFIVFAGQTLGMVLRDITSGAMMITEGWFHVGDFIKIEPFIDMSGVVERFTLRSTRIRNLNGEIIWVHNQQIAAVHVTPHGHRKYIIDIFTREPEKAKEVIQQIIDAVPASTALVKNPLTLGDTEKWGDNLWHITVHGKVAPGREWLIESFFIDAIKNTDEDSKVKDKLFVYPPTARFADPIAEKRFKRAIRVANK